MTRALVIQGASISLLCQVISFFVDIVLPGNAVAGVIAFIVIPTVLTLMITQRLQFALAFAFLNDIYSGGSGTWVKLGPMSGRWLLVFLFFIVIVFTAKFQRKNVSHLDGWHSLFVILFGVLLPVLLLVRAAFATGIVADKAVGDVAFLCMLFSYYSFRDLLAEHAGLLWGWIAGASAGLILVLLLMSVGPADYRSQVVAGVIGEVRYGTTISGVTRVSPVQVILVIFPFFLAFNTLVLQRLSLKGVLLTGAVALFSVAPLAVIYLRGPLLACGITILLIAYVVASSKRLNQTWKVAGAFVIVIAVVTTTMVAITPEEAGATFDVSGDEWFGRWLGASRTYQQREMLTLLEESPWLGVGVGMPMAGLEGKATTEFEMQYHMLLYRFGVVAFGMFMGGVIWILVEPFRFWPRRFRQTIGPFEIWSFSCLAATVSVLIAGAFNPYLRAPFAPLFLVLYFCTKERITRQGYRVPIPATKLVLRSAHAAL